MKRTITVGISLACLVALVPQSSVQALDFDAMLRNYLGSSPNSNPQTQAVIKTNINTRQAQLETDVQAGATSGQLTTTEEADLRADLNRVAALEGQYLSDGNLTPIETQTLLDELTSVTRRLQTYLTNATFVGGATYRHGQWDGGMRTYMRKYAGKGSPDDTPPNQRSIQANIDTRQAELDANIERGVTSGRLDWQDSRDLRTSLNTIANKETTFLADGKLSYREEEELVDDLDSLSTRITTAMERPGRRYAYGHGRNKHRRGSVDQRQSFLKQRINRGLASGQITYREANRLWQKEARINELEAKLRTTGGRLSYSEEKLVLAELDKLSRDIHNQLSDKEAY